MQLRKNCDECGHDDWDAKGKRCFNCNPSRRGMRPWPRRLKVVQAHKKKGHGAMLIINDGERMSAGQIAIVHRTKGGYRIVLEVQEEEQSTSNKKRTRKV